MSSNRERISQLQTDVSNLRSHVEQLSAVVDGKISDARSITEKREQIDQIYTHIENLKTQAQNLVDSVQGYQEEGVGAKDEIQNLLNEIEVKKQEIDQFEIKIFGDLNKETGEREGGLLASIKGIEKRGKEQLETQAKDHDSLKQEIESLLPGATSANLATAFKEQKESYKIPNRVWLALLVLSLVGLAFASALTFSESAGIENAFVSILARSPLVVPLVWLAWFAGKEFSQNKRLEQEYAHKEVIAKSLQGYKKQLEEVEDEQILGLFLTGVVSSLIFNPSDTLEKKSDDGYPPMFTSWIEKIKNSFIKSNSKSVGE